MQTCDCGWNCNRFHYCKKHKTRKGASPRRIEEHEGYSEERETLLSGFTQRCKVREEVGGSGPAHPASAHHSTIPVFHSSTIRIGSIMLALHGGAKRSALAATRRDAAPTRVLEDVNPLPPNADARDCVPPAWRHTHTHIQFDLVR